MGSSKKNKDRDRKKRKRDRSRSRSRERRDKHHRHHHKHKKHKRHREEHSPSISLSDLSDFESDFEIRKSVQEKENVRAPSPIPPSPLSPPSPSLTPPLPIAKEESKRDDSNETSLSIDESNKIRAKLGLKPLQASAPVKTVSQSEAENNDDTYKAGEVIHKPAQNLRDKLEVEKLREKIAAQREKRMQKQKLLKTKTLGVSDDETEDTKSWITKSRKLEKERKEAEKRNKMLEELDAQFGVGEMVEEELMHTKKRLYDSVHLSGLKVQHDVDRFSEGQTTILTLKDSLILGGDEDTLVNPNLEDAERVELNLKRKRMKPGAVDYDAPEIDPETGAIIQKTVLDKYDEEIEGQRKSSFRIGAQGTGVAVDGDSSSVDSSRKMARLRQLTTLEGPAHQLATEYLVPGEESVTFRKVKKKKKRKKKMLTADDLEPIEDAQAHLVSRSALRRGFPRNDDEIRAPTRVKSLRELMEEEDEEGGEYQNHTEMEGVEDGQQANKEDSEDEVEKEAIELQEALSRSRRAQQSSSSLGALTSDEVLADTLMEETQEEPVQPKKGLMVLKDEDPASMILNVTDEFCRSLGDIPTYGLSGNRAEDDAVRRPDSLPRTSGSSWGDAHSGAWEEVRIEDSRVEISGVERSAPILEEEPDTGRGVVNALRLAVKKGYLEKGSEKKPVNATLQHLRAVHYSIEDKTVEEERRGRGGDRYMGPTMDFREKDTYKPDVKLEYVDDEGRKLNAKEAFRYLSHKFHGKGSGKNKLEKRMKKWQEELLMKHMSSSDTPLQTLERQREKQRQLGAAYLVLSGNKTQEPLDVKK